MSVTYIRQVTHLLAVVMWSTGPITEFRLKFIRAATIYQKQQNSQNVGHSTLLHHILSTTAAVNYTIIPMLDVAQI